MKFNGSNLNREDKLRNIKESLNFMMYKNNSANSHQHTEEMLDAMAEAVTLMFEVFIEDKDNVVV